MPNSMRHKGEREVKDFRFAIKAVEEDGSFVGLASTYGNTDEQMDIVEPGAFTKTLNDRGPELPILWSHDVKQPIGLGRVEDSTEGLKIFGQLNLDKQIARDVHSDMKKRIVRGLSIGYETVKATVKENIRHLWELKLAEVSPCVFPANTSALIHGVKADFNEHYDMSAAMDAPGEMLDALREALCMTLWDTSLSAEDRIRQADAAIQQFHDRYVAALPDYFMAMGTEEQMYPMMGMMSRVLDGLKAGRRNSSSDMQRMRTMRDAAKQIMEHLDALMSEEAAPKGTLSGGAAPNPEPDSFHSGLRAVLDEELQAYDLTTSLKAAYRN